MSSNKYPNTSSEIDIKHIEIQTLETWSSQDTFQKSCKGEENFVFYDGPPFANGLPHYGHLLTGFIKDAFARYQTMLGKKVERRFGWDCHGLPAEMGTEKQLGISGRVAITKYGIEKFNSECAKSVMQFAQEWRKYVNRQARWVDFENDYKTMDIQFMESVIWAFKQLYDKGLIYQSSRVMPYSWSCETPVSNFETRIDNAYRTKESKAITIAFTLQSKLKLLPQFEIKMLVWTTTPWTVPSNLALAIGKKIRYKALLKNEKYFIASEHYWKINADENEKKRLIEISSQELIGLSYKPIFDYFANHQNAFKVLEADFVSEKDGTGIVHCAPGFGEEDFELCESKNIALVCPVDDSGKFTAQVPDFKGVVVLEANDDIIKELKKIGAWVKTEQHLHNYPHCWRTDKPLIYKSVNSWYLNVEKIRDRMVEVNQNVNWIPGHIKNGLFGKWIENARDWSISRNRFWGTPIPIWTSDDPKYPRIDVYGSIKEIEIDFNVKVTDLHRPFIDQLTRANPDDPTGKSTMKRVPEILDCWFESGSMPYAQLHYPFENKEKFEANFPADFITEYTAQTRGWFYTLMVLSTALFDSHPFKNCVCHGVILDKAGKKLSKRLNNYENPIDVFDKYGGESVRFLMLSDSVTYGGDLLLDGNAVKDSLRLAIRPIWSAYHFFCMYANIDKISAKKVSIRNSCKMDKYILSKTQNCINIVRSAMDQYDTVKTCKALLEVLDALNNWYIRRNRNRFWSRELNQNKIDAYNTLYTVLIQISLTFAPILPIITEQIWSGLTKKESVHLQNMPEYNKEIVDEELIYEMDLARSACKSALAIRNRFAIKIRQVLRSATIYIEDPEPNISPEYIDIIKQEINVKEVYFKKLSGEIAERTIKPDFKKIASRIPEKIKSIIQLIKTKSYSEMTNGTLFFPKQNITIYPEEFSVRIKTKNDSYDVISGFDMAAISLDVEVTQELIEEGKARDLVRLIQNARKDSNLEITDRIKLQIKTSDPVRKSAAEKYIEYIKEHTLAIDVKITIPSQKEEVIINKV